jgi:hypothetical protein
MMANPCIQKFEMIVLMEIFYIICYITHCGSMLINSLLRLFCSEFILFKNYLFKGGH